MLCRQLNVPHNRSSDEAVLHCHLGDKDALRPWQGSSGAKAYHMRMPGLVKHLDIIQSDIEESSVAIPVKARPEDQNMRRTHWSTDFRTPVMERSFLSSTVTRWTVRVLNTEKISYGQDQRLDEVVGACTHHVCGSRPR